jgi:hypothetical protein
MRNIGNWTPGQRAELVALVHAQAQAQIEGDAELREMADWMIETAGMAPGPEAYRLVFLVSVVMHSAQGG